MKKIEAIVLNSFTDSISGGNAASLVFGFDFDKSEMLTIAKKSRII